MELKEYQKQAVARLIEKSRSLLEKPGHHFCVFKAPTGSGKTIMIAEYLKQITEESLGSFSYIWLSGYDLHTQSRKKLEAYLSDSLYTFSFLEEVQTSRLDENEVLFVNWHSLTKKDATTGEYSNVYMRDNEYERNLRTFVNNTRQEGRQIILIIDESHYHYWSEASQDLVQNVIAPKLTVEV